MTEARYFLILAAMSVALAFVGATSSAEETDKHSATPLRTTLRLSVLWGHSAMPDAMTPGTDTSGIWFVDEPLVIEIAVVAETEPYHILARDPDRLPTEIVVPDQWTTKAAIHAEPFGPNGRASHFPAAEAKSLPISDLELLEWGLRTRESRQNEQQRGLQAYERLLTEVKLQKWDGILKS